MKSKPITTQKPDSEDQFHADKYIIIKPMITEVELLANIIYVRTQ